MDIGDKGRLQFVKGNECVVIVIPEGHEPVASYAALAGLDGACGLADYVRRTVDQAPPLTPEQRDRLALLLRPTEGSPAQAAM